MNEFKLTPEKKLKWWGNGCWSPLFMRTYRNLDFCIEQCKLIVDQLIEIQSKSAK